MPKLILMTFYPPSVTSGKSKAAWVALQGFFCILVVAPRRSPHHALSISFEVSAGRGVFLEHLKHGAFIIIINYIHNRLHVGGRMNLAKVPRRNVLRTDSRWGNLYPKGAFLSITIAESEPSPEKCLLLGSSDAAHVQLTPAPLLTVTGVGQAFSVPK